MSYIYSKYNIAQKDIDDNYVLYNCLSNTYCVVREQEHFEKIRSGEAVDPELVELGFLVEEGTNEIALAEYYLNQKINPKFLNLFIVPTRFCNFDCVYCYEEHKPLYMNFETQQEVVRFVKNTLPKYSGIIVTWFGGEPTVALKAVDYISSEINAVPVISVVIVVVSSIYRACSQGLRKCQIIGPLLLANVLFEIRGRYSWSIKTKRRYVYR